jgi:predicted NodU family carbamoyl transferase
MQSPPDFILENHGSILLLRPQNENAIAWLNQNIGSGNGFQPYWPTIVVEHRYIWAILVGIRDDGLEVSRG